MVKIKITILSSPARHNEACGHGCRALCRILHLFSWHNSTTRTFSTILIPQNTLFWNSAIRIPQSTPSLYAHISCALFPYLHVTIPRLEMSCSFSHVHCRQYSRCSQHECHCSIYWVLVKSRCMDLRILRHS